MTYPAFTDGTTSFPGITVALNSINTFQVPTFKDNDGDSV